MTYFEWLRIRFAGRIASVPLLRREVSAQLLTGTRFLATSEMVTTATFSASHRTKRLRRSHLWHASATAVVLAALLSAPACAQKKEEAAEVPAPTGEPVANL